MSLLRQQQKQLQAALGSTWLALASSGSFWLLLALSGLGFTFFYCYINQNRKSDFATIQQFRLRWLRVPGNKTFVHLVPAKWLKFFSL